jgi:hypothetical protein
MWRLVGATEFCFVAERDVTLVTKPTDCLNRRIRPISQLCWRTVSTQGMEHA